MKPRLSLLVLVGLNSLTSVNARESLSVPIEPFFLEAGEGVQEIAQQVFSPLCSLGSWPESQALAAQLVSKMTLEDKLKVLKGQGMFTGKLSYSSWFLLFLNSIDLVKSLKVQDG